MSEETFIVIALDRRPLFRHKNERAKNDDVNSIRVCVGAFCVCKCSLILHESFIYLFIF